MVIINDDNWMSAMKNKTWEQNHVTTPIRKLITKLPGKLCCFDLNGKIMLAVLNTLSQFR